MSGAIAGPEAFGGKKRPPLTPYIRFDLDAIKLVGPTARKAGLADHFIGHGLVLLWSWVRASKTAIASTDLLEGFFTGKTEKVLGALVTFGFAEDLGSGQFRVRGAERYLQVSASRSVAGRKGGQTTAASGKCFGNLRGPRGNAEANASEAPKQRRSNDAPNTYHLAPSSKQEAEALSAEADAAAALFSSRAVGRNERSADREPLASRPSISATASSAAAQAASAQTTQTGAPQNMDRRGRKKAEATSADDSNLVALWLDICPELPQWVVIGKPRLALVSKASKRRSLTEWREVFERIAASSFCRGSTGWRADLGWALRADGAKPETAALVLEGKYDDNGAATPAKKLNQSVEYKSSDGDPYADQMGDFEVAHAAKHAAGEPARTGKPRTAYEALHPALTADQRTES